MPTGTDNFNDSLPAAPTGFANVKWLADVPSASPRNITASFPNIGSVNVQTGASYTLQISDNGKLLIFTNAAAVAVTADSTVTITNFTCSLLFLGAGGGVVTPSSGTINNVASATFLKNQGGELFFDSTNWWLQPAAGSPGPYDVIFSLPGLMDNPGPVTYLIITFTRAVTFPGNFAGAKGHVLTNPGGTVTYTLLKSGVSCGTVAVANTGVFTFTSTGGTAVSFAIGDYLEVTSPSPPDASLADFEFTLAGTR